MKITIICPEYDPVCVGEELYSSINKYTKHKCRYIIGCENNINGVSLHKNVDIIVGKTHSDEEIKDIILGSDVLHFNQNDWTFNPEKLGLHGFNYNSLIDGGQKLIFHGHGGAWLLSPEEQIQRCRNVNATIVTCSPIDEAVLGESVWMPNIVDIDCEYLRPVERDYYSSELRVGQAVTVSASMYKGSGILQYVCDYLRKFGYCIDLDLIEGLPKKMACSRRQQHHLTVDNWTQGFHGLSGLEGLAMGHVVISRFADLSRKAWDEMFKEPIPIVDVYGMDHCGKTLRYFHNDRDALKDHGLRSRRWMEKNYNCRNITRKWIELYASLPKRRKKIMFKHSYLNSIINKYRNEDLGYYDYNNKKKFSFDSLSKDKHKLCIVYGNLPNGFCLELMQNVHNKTIINYFKNYDKNESVVVMA